jgi:hypothetical protein
MIVPSEPGSAPSRVALILTISFGVVAIAALLVRVLAIAEPLGIDQGLWASAVRGMSRGQRLYADVWEQRPPGIYWTYLAAFRLFGWTAAAVAWADVLAAAATTLLLYLMTRRLNGSIAAVLAAALYAALTIPAWLYRYDGFLERSVCETFIVVCVALGAWCAARFHGTGSLVFAAGVGLSMGAAIVYKPNAGVYLPALWLWMLLYRRESSRTTLADSARIGAVAAVAVLIVPAVALLWVWRIGVLDEARIAVIDFNRFYVAEGLTLSGYALEFSKAAFLRMKTDPLWLGGAIGVLVAGWDLARTRRLSPLAGLAILWGSAAALVIIVNGARLYNTYFIQAFPPLALLTAWLLSDSARGSRGRRVLAGATALLMVAVLAQRHYPAKVLDWAIADLDVLRGRADRTTLLERFGGYANARGYSARANTELAAYVREHTAPDDRIFLFGINGADVYFASDRLTAHRFLRVNFFVETSFPDPRFRLDVVTAELAARRPRYLIFEQLHSSSEMGKAVDSLSQQPSIVRLLGSYQPEAHIEDFTLYRRID